MHLWWATSVRLSITPQSTLLPPLQWDWLIQGDAFLLSECFKTSAPHNKHQPHSSESETITPTFHILWSSADNTSNSAALFNYSNVLKRSASLRVISAGQNCQNLKRLESTKHQYPVQKSFLNNWSSPWTFEKLPLYCTHCMHDSMTNTL